MYLVGAVTVVYKHQWQAQGSPRQAEFTNRIKARGEMEKKRGGGGVSHMLICNLRIKKTILTLPGGLQIC